MPSMNSEDLKQIKEIIDSSLETHLSKVHEEISDFREEFESFRIESSEHFQTFHVEIADIRRDLEDLMEKFENVTGYRKEIDHALERIAAIEKHLSIRKKMAA